MTFFHPLDGYVMLRVRSGTFSEHQIYHNNKNELFARKGNGYVRLLAHNATSLRNVFWEEIELQLPYRVEISKLVIAGPYPETKAA